MFVGSSDTGEQLIMVSILSSNNLCTIADNIEHVSQASWSSLAGISQTACICSTLSRNLCNLEIALRILRILKLRANLEIMHSQSW